MESSPNRLHGMLIAHLALMKSLISVLPREALQALLLELERDIGFGKDYLLGQQLSEDALDAYGVQVDQLLAIVRDQMTQKEALQSSDGVLHWMKGRLDPSPKD